MVIGQRPSRAYWSVIRLFQSERAAIGRAEPDREFLFSVIVFAKEAYYTARMIQASNHNFAVKRLSGGFRRLMFICFAFVYVFIGIAHNISCLDQAAASGIAFERVADTADDGAKNGAAACDHRPTCAPAVLPVPSVAAVPTGVPAAPVLTVAPVLIAVQSRLDIPPPKFLN